MKPWLVGILTSVFVVAGLVALRDHAAAMWNAPQELNELSQEYQESYQRNEAYIAKQQEYNAQQMTANQLNEERWQQYQEDSRKNWEVMMELIKK